MADINGNRIVAPFSSVANNLTWSMKEWVNGCSTRRNEYVPLTGFGWVIKVCFIITSFPADYVC